MGRSHSVLDYDRSRSLNPILFNRLLLFHFSLINSRLVIPHRLIWPSTSYRSIILFDIAEKA